MSDILYLKIDQNVKVTRSVVALSDIASLTCTDTAIVNHLKTLRVHVFHAPKSGNVNKNQMVVVSVLKIIELIGKEYPKLQVENVGSPDFVLEYIPKEGPAWLDITKAAFICILIFFGSAFTIMTFNNDVGVTDVFAKFYEQVMGKSSNGFTPLEVCYSIGLGLGILLFFNHFGRKKVTHDPTPMQVQMRMYEQDVDTTFIENSSRKGTNVDVD